MSKYMFMRLLKITELSKITIPNQEIQIDKEKLPDSTRKKNMKKNYDIGIRLIEWKAAV